MYRKRIGNVTFFPGIEQLAPSPSTLSRNSASRKIARLARLAPHLAEFVEKEIIDKMLAELDKPAAGGAR